MLTKRDLELLRGFQVPQGSPVVSLYLNTDGKTHSRKEVETRLKDLGRIARQRLEAHPSKEFRRQGIDELHRVEEYVLHASKDFSFRGLALFGCAVGELWHEVQLPRPPRDRLLVGDTPYIRPLQFQDLEYQRCCTVLLDRQAARIFLIYQGAILEYKSVSHDVPARVRWGGWAGYDESRAARKADQRVGAHFQAVADTLFDLFKRDHFDCLIVGCRPEHLREFESCLHSYLRDRVAAYLDLPMETPEHEVLERSVKIEQGLRLKEHIRQVERLEQRIGEGGLTVKGLEDVLRHLNGSAVETLLVSRDFTAQGCRCPSCGVLGILEVACPLCGHAMLETPDVVTEAIDRALAINCEVQQLFEGVGLERLGSVAANVRFRI